MSNMAILTQSFAVGGVKDQREQFRDLLLMVRFLSGVAATLTKSVSVSQNGMTPLSPPRITVQPAGNELDDPFWPVPFPERMIRPAQVFAHPQSLADVGTEVVLSNFLTGWRALLRFSAPVANDGGNPQVFFAPCSHAAGSSTEASGLTRGCYLKGVSAPFTSLIKKLWHSIGILLGKCNTNKEGGQVCYG